MDALIRIGDLPTFAPVPEVIQRRDALLVACQAVTVIEDQMDADAAAEILAQATAVVRIVEKSRGEIKSPVLDLCRTIDSVAKEITAPLAGEVSRIQRLIGAFKEALFATPTLPGVRVTQTPVASIRTSTHA